MRGGFSYQEQPTMFDVSAYKNASVRQRSTGRQGKLENVSAPWVAVDWITATGLQRQCVLRTDPLLDEDIEVYTDNKGWIPVASLVGGRRVARERAEAVEQAQSSIGTQLLKRTESLFGRLTAPFLAEAEDKKGGKTGGSPWKNKSTRGPTSSKVALGKPGAKAPFGKSGPSADKKTGRFTNCKGSNYVNTCTDSETGKTITVKIDKKYKAAYNNRYRKFIKAKKGEGAAKAAAEA